MMTEGISQEKDLDSTEVTSGVDEAGESEEERLTRVLEEFENLKDRHLRLAAEFNNFKRRSEQERLESWSRAQADILSSFLNVLDDLNRVAELELSTATVEGVMDGINLVEKKFISVLQDSGAEIIDPLGDLFDPERMEAIVRVPTERLRKGHLQADVRLHQKGNLFQRLAKG